MIDSNLISHNFKSYLIKIIIHLDSLKKRSYLTSSDCNFIVNQKYLDNLQFNLEIENIFNLNNLQEGFIYHYLTTNKINEHKIIIRKQPIKKDSSGLKLPISLSAFESSNLIQSITTATKKMKQQHQLQTSKKHSFDDKS